MSDWGSPPLEPRHRRNSWRRDLWRFARPLLGAVPWEWVLLIGAMAIIMKIGFK